MGFSHRLLDPEAGSAGLQVTSSKSIRADLTLTKYRQFAKCDNDASPFMCLFLLDVRKKRKVCYFFGGDGFLSKLLGAMTTTLENGFKPQLECAKDVCSPPPSSTSSLKIMADALEYHEGTVSIGGRTITNLCFANNTDGLAGQEQVLVKLVNHIEEASTAYGMQISAEKTQLMTNNTNGISTDITTDNKKLETVRSFKYLGASVSDERSKPEVLTRIAHTTAAVTKLKVIWKDKNIAISFKIRLIRSPAMSIFLYACETWTITVDTERRIQA